MNKVPMQLLVDSKDSTATLTMYGDITSLVWDEADTCAVDVAKAIGDLPANVSELCVRINSYGGEVAEGLAIYNALKASGKRVTTVCDGFACSIASVIFAAGERRIMHEASALMIHNPWTYTMGNPDQLRKEADDLDKIAQLSRAAYASVTALTEGEIAQLMDDETWITPEEALDMGFATEIEEESNPAPQQAVIAQMVQRLCGKEKPVQRVAVELSKDQMDEIHAYVHEACEQFVQQMKEDPTPQADVGKAVEPEPIEPAPTESFLQKLKRITTTE